MRECGENYQNRDGMKLVIRLRRFLHHVAKMIQLRTLFDPEFGSWCRLGHCLIFVPGIQDLRVPLPVAITQPSLNSSWMIEGLLLGLTGLAKSAPQGLLHEIRAIQCRR